MTYLIIGLLILIGGLFLVKSGNTNITASTSIQSIGAKEARDMIKSGKPTIIDVRTPMEVSSGKIKNALTINVASPSFKNEINKLDKNTTYIVYCRSGRRSMNACNTMSKEGFTDLYNLEGGYNAWK